MNEEKDLWIEKVMESHKGKIMLSPSESLFDDILQQTNLIRPLSVKSMSFVGVAASVLILINCVAIQSISTPDNSDIAAVSYETEYISDYNLYEYD